jgi:Haem-binding domain
MKKVFKTIGWLLLIALVLIQFFRPTKNIHEGDQPNAISKKFHVSADVKIILDKACMDCHSNNTRYPWYNNIQPVAWWLNNHVIDGKKELNFDEYVTRRPRFQYRRMEQTIDLVKKKEMPLDSYTWTHKDAILTEEEKTKLYAWAKSVMNALEAQYPIDSLKRPSPQPSQK